MCDLNVNGETCAYPPSLITHSTRRTRKKSRCYIPFLLLFIKPLRQLLLFYRHMQNSAEESPASSDAELKTPDLQNLPARPESPGATVAVVSIANLSMGGQSSIPDPVRSRAVDVIFADNEEGGGAAASVGRGHRAELHRRRSVLPGGISVGDGRLDTYAMQPLLLYFLNDEVEMRYFNFQYVDNSFIPGKMFALMWCAIFLLSFVVFTAPWNESGGYTARSFHSTWWIGSYITAGLNIILFVGLFVERLKPYRELFHILQIVLGWPTMMLALLELKRPDIVRYACMFGCFMFNMVIAQCRICRSLPLVTIWPLACLLTVTFSVPGYWDHHTKIELLFVPVFLSPLFLLHFLERLTRQSFAERELATVAIAEIEHKTVVTQQMIVNFFPATPTRDLLAVKRYGYTGSTLSRNYHATVLVVTDIVGFTAFTSRSRPDDVISMLTTMFQSFDRAAETYGVEKIATVGDSYCGGIFPDRFSPNGTQTRCMQSVMFSCSALGFAGSSLQLRVGTHIGDVSGVFVGCAPPKFDVFGPGIDRTRLLEEGGQPGFVHVSNTLVESAGISPYHLSSLTKTPLGVLCQAWTDLCGENDDLALDFSEAVLERNYQKGSNSSDVSQGPPSNDVACDAGAPLCSDHIVETLCALAQVHPPDVSSFESAAKTGDLKDADIIGAASDYSHKSDDEDGGDNNDNNGNDVVSSQLQFSNFYLTFAKPSVEKRFQKNVRESGVGGFCAKLFLGMTFGLFVIQLNIQCGSSQDLGVASAIMVVLTGMATYINFLGTNHIYHFPISFLAYNSLQVLTFLGLLSECGGTIEKRYSYLSDIAGCYYCIAIFAPQYCFDVRLSTRFAFTLVTCVVMAVSMVIRHYTIGDLVAQLDPAPIYGGVFVIMAFFPEYSLRTAFQTQMHLTKLRKVAKSKGASMSTSALSIMLPTFVTDHIVARAKRKQHGDRNVDDGHGAALSEAGTLTTATSTASSSDGIIDLAALAVTWEYNHVVVMFAKFESPGKSPLTPDLINLTVQAIEQVIQQFDVRKVKSVGSVVMMVAGIDDVRSRQEQISSVADSAIAIRACIFEHMKIPGLEYKIGIHCGPCFGAVIGGSGASFDIFGDTVNTSSRMMSTARAGTILISARAKELLMPRLKGLTAPEPLVEVKGKGMMETHSFNSDAGVRDLPSSFWMSTSLDFEKMPSSGFPLSGSAPSTLKLHSLMESWRRSIANNNRHNPPIAAVATAVQQQSSLRED